MKCGILDLLVLLVHSRVPTCTKEIRNARQNSSFWHFVYHFHYDSDGFIHAETEKSDLCVLFPEGEHKSRIKTQLFAPHL